MKDKVVKFIFKFFGRMLLCAVIVLIGFILMRVLIAQKEEPARANVPELTLKVQVTEVQPEDVPVIIRENGVVRALDVVSVAAEVPGNIVEIHPRLERGEVIPQGDLLFRIDPRDYTAARDQAAAQVAQTQSAVAALKKQLDIDRKRLGTLRRSRDLSKTEYERAKKLEGEQVGTQSGVDQAEISFNQAEDAYDQLSRAVDLYPIRISEAESVLAGAEAQLARAEANLDRTEVRALFDARVKSVELERGQYVTPGAPVLTLANDSVLEISVGLDRQDVRAWLRFDTQKSGEGNGWFGDLVSVPCRIYWTANEDVCIAQGELHRVEDIDQRTRTVTVAVRVNAKQTLSESGGIPLVEGMFCRVDITGKVMRQVYRLPRWAVSFEGGDFQRGQVYVAENNRLQRRMVNIVRYDGEEAFVSEGLYPADKVIVTRLVNPFPNSLLDIQAGGEEGLVQ